jgi:hypothetical protein
MRKDRAGGGLPGAYFRPSGDEAKLFNSLKEVFFNEPTRLQFASLFVVYSAPPYLHAVLPGVSNGFSQSVALPNFKVIQRDGSRNEDGICRMREIVDRRFPKWREILDETVMNHLAWMSGAMCGVSSTCCAPSPARRP